MNTLSDSMEQFGALLVPMVDKVSEFIKQLGDGLANLEPETRQTIVMFAGIAAAIGPVLLVVGKLITSIVAIKGVLAGIVAAVSAPVLAVIAVIAALVAAFVVAWQNSEQFRITVTKAFNDVRDGVVEAWHGFIKPAIDQLVASLQEHVLPAVDRMAQTFAEAWPAISSAVTSAWGYIQPVLQALVSFIANYLIPALAFLAEVAVMTWTNIAQSAAGMWTHYVQPALSALRTGFDAVANFLSARVGDIVNVFSGIASAITGPFRTAFNFIADAWNSTIGGFGVDVPNIPGLPFGGQRIAFPTMPTFNKGGIVPGIPGDPQMAILHAGEMVLRRSEVDQYRRDRQNTSTTRGGDVYVTVNKTEASPYEIGRELLWAMKVAG
jgi:phage-related protein